MARSSAAEIPATRRRSQRNEEPPAPSRVARLLAEAACIVGALLVLALAAFLFTYQRGDPGFSHAVTGGAIANAGGRVGAWIADVLLYVFGFSAWIWVGAGAAWVIRGFRRLHAPYDEKGLPDWAQALGLVVLLLAATGLESLRMRGLVTVLPDAAGGVLGGVVAPPIAAALGTTSASVLLIVLVAIGASLFFDFSWLAVAERVGTLFEGFVATHARQARGEGRPGDRRGGRARARAQAGAGARADRGCCPGAHRATAHARARVVAQAERKAGAAVRRDVGRQIARARPAGRTAAEF